MFLTKDMHPPLWGFFVQDYRAGLDCLVEQPNQRCPKANAIHGKFLYHACPKLSSIREVLADLFKLGMI